MAKITLLKAFTLRKRLRTIIDNIIGELREAQTFIKVSSKYPDGYIISGNEKPFDHNGLSLLDTYKLLNTANGHMLTLNNLIDEANVVHARKIINELELEKGKAGMLKRLASNRKNFSESVSEYQVISDSVIGSDTARGLVTTKYQLTDDFDWIKEAENCRKKIVKLEDKLAEANASTQIEIDDKLLSFIEENI